MTASESTLDSPSELLLAAAVDANLTLLRLLVCLALLRSRRSWCATRGFGEQRDCSPLCRRISAG